MFFCATGITPAMAVKLPAGVGSQYACAFVDNKGCAFDGGRTYGVDVLHARVRGVLIRGERLEDGVRRRQSWSSIRTAPPT
jgi:hypothetical protein